MWLDMKYIKIHWKHNFPADPEFIYSEIDEDGYEVRKVEIFKNGTSIVYSDKINPDGLAEGEYPSLSDLTFEEDVESMTATEINKDEFCKIWNEKINNL